MKTASRLLLACALVLALPACATKKSGGPQGGAGGHADTARYLAGLPGPPRNDWSVPRSSPAWKNHASRMDGLWARQSGRASHIRRFRGELGGLGSPKLLFYPFGGPDYLHASALFPGARTYVLVGLESAEPMPDLAGLAAADLERGLHGVTHSLRTLVEAGYFVTTEMRADLASSPLRGTLPLLLAQIARDGKEVTSVEAVGLDAAGNLTSRGGRCPGWRILAGGREIFYFQEDLSNHGLGDQRLLRFLSQRGAPVTFAKSASYLMHEGSFSTIRDYIVNSSSGLVQDPSGVPYRHLLGSGWKIRLHGNYLGAQDPFTRYRQPDLAAAFVEKVHPVKPMSFGLGYLYDPRNTCLIVGTR